jgi:hypothetical protein
MLFSRKSKGYFVSLSDQGLQVARTSAPQLPFAVEELRECPAGDAGARGEMLKQAQGGRSSGGYLQSVVGAHPPRRLVRRHTVDAKRVKEPGYFAELCAQQFRVEFDKYALAVVSAADGSEFDPAGSLQKDLLFCGLPSEDVASLQAQLLEYGIYPRRLELGTIALLGGVSDCLAHARAKTPVLVVEVGADVTHTFIVTASGVEASRPIAHGFAAMVPLMQKELGLKDEEAARKMFFSNTFDFTGLAPVLLRRLVADLQSSTGFYEVQTGQSVAQVFTTQLPGPLAWLDSALVSALGIPAFRPDPLPWLASRQVTVPDALAATARDPRWFGLLSLMVQTNAADAVPVQEKK